MHATRALMIVAAGMLPAPALGCTIFWRPFSQEVRTAGRHTWAVRADATVQFDRYEPAGVRGTLRLENIRCYRKPRGTECPVSLAIPFDYEDDGSSCPSTMARSFGQPYPRLRYFTLNRYDDGVWRLDTAFETYWRE